MPTDSDSSVSVYLSTTPIGAKLPHMNRKRHLPEEVRGFLGSIFFVPLVSAIAMLAAVLIPSAAALRRIEVGRLFAVGLAAGIVGVILLFFARLPLYRQHRFWTVGPRALDRLHRRLYWLAYLCVLAGIGLLVLVWFRLG